MIRETASVFTPSQKTALTSSTDTRDTGKMLPGMEMERFTGKCEFVNL